MRDGVGSLALTNHRPLEASLGRQGRSPLTISRPATVPFSGPRRHGLIPTLQLRLEAVSGF